MEFQAVILAGGQGTRLYPMTDGVPKCLLPVANRPLLYYQLRLLEVNHFKEVIVCTSADAKEEVATLVAESTLQVDLQVVDAEVETADVLRSIKDRIKKDFVVVSGDLITDVKIYHLADVHRINDATCTVLLRGPKKVDPRATGGKAAKPDPAADFVGLDEKRSRLLFLKPAADVEEKISFPKRQLEQYPLATITNKMLDAHLYIFSRWVLDLLELNKDLTSIKVELLPYLVNEAQFSKRPIPGQPKVERNEDWVVDENEVGEDEYVPITCHAMVLEDGYCARADSLRTYKEMNFEVTKHGHGAHVPWEPRKSFPDKSDEEKKALLKMVGSDCVVSEGFAIGPQSSVKKTVVGKHVTIGKDCKIDNCIIHNHATIEDECVLSGCVIGDNCHVGRDSSLTNCTLGPKYTVEPETEAKNETYSESQ